MAASTLKKQQQSRLSWEVFCTSLGSSVLGGIHLSFICKGVFHLGGQCPALNQSLLSALLPKESICGDKPWTQSSLITSRVVCNKDLTCLSFTTSKTHAVSPWTTGIPGADLHLGNWMNTKPQCATIYRIQFSQRPLPAAKRNLETKRAKQQVDLVR